MKLKSIFILIVLISFFQGCTQSNLELKNIKLKNIEAEVKDVFKTENALQIHKNYEDICKLLIKYKKKLDKRNPKAYNKALEKSIVENIRYQKNTLSLSGFKNDYKKYLKKALSTNPNIKYKNDFLILGIYKLLSIVYDIEDEKYTALTYNINNFKKLSEMLQMIQWQIHNVKDSKNNYLFLTWQNNWQIEFAKKTNIKNPNYKLIKNLKYIKSKKENLFDPSNMSFEILFSKIVYINNNSIRRLGGEPDEIGLKALKSLIFLL